MVKLQDLRNPRHVRLPLYVLFAVVVVSFVFFYGWHPTEGDRGTGQYGKLKSDTFSLFKKWTYIGKSEMTQANQHLIREKESLLPSYVRQIYQQRPGMMETIMGKIVTQPEIAQDAADTIVTGRAARKMGIVVTSQDIIDRLKQQQQQQPGLTDEMLDQYAAQMGLSGGKHELIELERRNNELERVRAVKSMVAHASLFELWQEYSLANEKLTLRLAAFPNDAFTSSVVVSDTDIQKYFNEHKEDYRVPTQRRYLYIKVTREELGKTIKPTPDQLLDYFNKNKEKYAEPAAVQARELFVAVRGGESVERVMTIMNDLRTSAAATAEWNALADQARDKYKLNIYSRETPWLTQDAPERPAAYMERLSTLAVDQVSTPILAAASDGVTTSVTIAKITARREAGVPAFDKVRDRVSADYVAQETDNLMKLRGEEWKAARAKVKTLAELAKAIGVDDKITTMVDALDYRIPGVGTFAENRDYVAGLAVDEISDPIPSEDGLVALQPTDQVDAHDRKLEEVRPRVIAAIQNERAGDLARAAAQNALQLIQGGAKFDQALADAPVKPVATEPQTRLEPIKVIGAPMIDFTKQTLRVAKGSVGMTPYGQDKDKPAGYAVWTIVDLQPVSRAQFAAERQRFEREYLQIQRLAIVDEWLRDQRAQADFQVTQAER